MRTAFLDTHAWAWSLQGDDHLSRRAADMITNAGSVLVSPVSLYEIGQKVRLGKWPNMAPLAPMLLAILDQQGAEVAPLDPAICLRAGSMDWAHRDPFDRLLAATALELGVPIISADTVFDGVVQRIW